MRFLSFLSGGIFRKKTEQNAEPDRDNTAVFRKGLCRFESQVAGRLCVGFFS